ncbi:alternative oxidase-domain-containing protein [Paraphysoderma sedebokerense]|nr:alternative oxidase-domain-containing protein [Paraphysoderma sedebokerense]
MFPSVGILSRCASSNRTFLSLVSSHSTSRLRHAFPNSVARSFSVVPFQLQSTTTVVPPAQQASTETENTEVLERLRKETQQLLVHEPHPFPVRREFIKDQPITTKELESLDVGLNKHREPQDFRDKFALGMVKTMRKPTDWFFKTKYIHRAVMLETVAAVPGMVGAVLRHLRSLRTLRHDGGWIYHLLHEAENERMHLMTFMKITKPNIWERALVTSVQGVFFNAFFLLYLVSPKTAHRVVGYLEEEAVISYTHFLKEIDAGRIQNTPAPDIAKEYWNLEPTATLRDVVLAIRADEAAHRDTNHHFSDRVKFRAEDLRVNHKVDKSSWMVKANTGNVKKE